jgi:hypothetical protein
MYRFTQNARGLCHIFNEILIFLGLSKNTRILNLLKTVQWQPNWPTWTDRRTDGIRQTDMKLIGVFRNFANAPKKLTFLTDCALLIYSVWLSQQTGIYSGPSSYDRLYIRTTWVTTKNFSFDLRPKSWVTTRMPVKATCVTTRMAFVSLFVDVIPVSALFCSINFANCYQNGPQKARK